MNSSSEAVLEALQPSVAQLAVTKLQTSAGFCTALAVLVVLLVALGQSKQHGEYENAPGVIGFGPRMLSGTLYSLDPAKVIEQGYRKFRDGAFRVIRGDVDMIFLPPSALPEVSALPPEVASNLGALNFDLVALFKALGMPSTKGNRLHHRVVQNKATQNLAQSRPSMEDEFDRALADYFPQTEEWTEVKPYWALLKIVARASSRVLVGRPWCDDPAWLGFSVDFIENTLNSSIEMRRFPTWTYPVLARLLPSFRTLKKACQEAHRILGPVFAQKLREQDEGTYRRTNEEENGIDWLCEIAEGEERNPATLVTVEIILSLASVHTSSFNAMNTLYDIMDHPELLELLREEMVEARQKQTKDPYSGLAKTDSVLRESQRFAPPSIIGLRRMMREDVVLNDGTRLPKGAYVCAGTFSIQQMATEDADTYDGLRSYKVRSGKSDTSKNSFTSAEVNALAWGLGKSACPGRWFASQLLKILLSKMLTQYEFKYPPGVSSRPLNSFGHEFLMPQREAKILVRRRSAAA